MKLGLFGGRADCRGLAYQTQAYAKWLEPDRIYGIDQTADGLSPYPCDWRPFWDCPELTVCQFSQITEEGVRRWLRGLDVVLGAETFYFPDFPIWAKQEGVRTVLHINPEFTGWWGNNKKAPMPDLLLNPTIWRQEHLPGVQHFPFPVDRERFPFRLRTSAEHFVHVAGHAAAADRAGTRIVAAQSPQMKNLRVTVRSQSPLKLQSPHALRFLDFQQFNVSDPRKLYQDADVVIQPRRYGGNNLVAYEALSSGCPLITLDRDPERRWGGVKVVSSRLRGHIRTTAGLIPLHDAQQTALASTMRRLAADPAEVERLSKEADVYAQSVSWDNLLGPFMDILKC